MFLNPLGLLALLGVPAVVAMHLFRRRFRRQRVSALFLWEARTTTSVSGRRRDRILNSPSFWCELLMALLLGLACAGPRACGQLEAKHLVVVLDGSASMSANTPGTDGNPSAAEQARERVRDAIDQLPSGSRVTIVESGPSPHILIGPAAFPEEARARLGEYKPQAARHDLAPAVTLAMQLAGAGSLTLYTDEFRPASFPEQVGIVALGQARENLAITRAARFPGGADGEDVLISVANFSRRQRKVQLQLVQADQVLAESEGLLQAGERQRFQFKLSAGTGLVEARLPADALNADNQASLAALPSRTLALYTDLPAELRTALGLQRGTLSPIDHWLALVGDSVAAGDAALADFVISDQVPHGEETWALVLHAVAGQPLDLIGPFLVEKRHPAVSGILLDGVVWSAGSQTQLPGLPLISAGDLVLLSEEQTGQRRVFHMNINWQRSSLQRTPDWPILLANLAELRRRELHGPRSTNLGAGEAFQYNTSEEANYVLFTPSGERELRARGPLTIDALDEIGVYELKRGGQSLAQFAVHFADDAESDLRKASQGERLSAVELGEQRSSSSLVVLILALLSLVALLLDWWVLRSRLLEQAGRGQAEASV